MNRIQTRPLSSLRPRFRERVVHAVNLSVPARESVVIVRSRSRRRRRRSSRFDDEEEDGGGGGHRRRRNGLRPLPVLGTKDEEKKKKTKKRRTRRRRKRRRRSDSSSAKNARPRGGMRHFFSSSGKRRAPRPGAGSASKVFFEREFLGKSEVKIQHKKQSATTQRTSRAEHAFFRRGEEGRHTTTRRSAV